MQGRDTRHTVPDEVVEELFRTSDGVPSACQLRVICDGQPTKPRTYHVVPRMGPCHNFGVFNNGVRSVERALLERYFLCQVDGTFHRSVAVKAGVFSSSLLSGVRRVVVDLVRPQATVLQTAQVVKLYTGAKRRVYEAAHRSLMRSKVNRKDASLRPFTKFEKQPLTKACRIINPRSPRYNLSLGKYLKHMEKKYYEGLNVAWGGHTAHTVIKGLNVVESAAVIRAKWERFTTPVAIGLDATKFDMHVSVEALRYEHGFYNRVFRDRALAKLLSWQINNRGVAYCPDGQVRFSMPGTRSSGDLNTSLGNCILMCSMVLAMVKELGVQAELCNNGDDCVLMLEATDAERVVGYIRPFFLRHGFRMEVEPVVDVFESVEFCQSRPVFDGEKWVMVRNLSACLRKDPMCLVPLQNDRVWRKWLGAVGDCGVSLVSGIPVLQAFYECFQRNGVASGDKFKRHVFKNTSQEERSKGVSVARREVSAEARASFWRAFGLPPDYQVGLETYYDALSIGGLGDDVGTGPADTRPPAFLRHL